jgi:hypothetical protein
MAVQTTFEGEGSLKEGGIHNGDKEESHEEGSQEKEKVTYPARHWPR